jgi:hypothetical protein
VNQLIMDVYFACIKECIPIPADEDVSRASSSACLCIGLQGADGCTNVLQTN